MQDLFGNSTEKVAAMRKKSADYAEFVEKFKAEKTTDDCFTPPEAYNAVADYVEKTFGASRDHFVRPFYPGGNYQAVDYRPEDIVVDNPPFSIITQIVKWYNAHGVRYFLFAPHLTLFSPGRFCTSVVCGQQITYANGAKVPTSFVSNMYPDGVKIVTCPSLYKVLNLLGKKQIKKYSMPANIINVTKLVRQNRLGNYVEIREDESQFVSGQQFFGGAFAVSDEAAKRVPYSYEDEHIEITLPVNIQNIISKLNGGGGFNALDFE